jgi:hypothetical protein
MRTAVGSILAAGFAPAAGCPILQTDVLMAVVKQDGRARRSRPRFYCLALARLADDLCLIAGTPTGVGWP